MLEEDVQSCLRYRRDGKLSFRAWADSLRGVQEAAWFALDDPAPFLIRTWGASETPSVWALYDQTHGPQGRGPFEDLRIVRGFTVRGSHEQPPSS